MVENRPNRDLGASEVKSLFVFSICFAWSDDRYHLRLTLPSDTGLWSRSVDLQRQAAKKFLRHKLLARFVLTALPALETNHNWSRAPRVSTTRSGHLLWALQFLSGMPNPPLILPDVVITGHKRFNDKQHGDKQTACNAAARRPGKSVWIPYRKRRFQNQRNQGGKSWDVCWEHWLAQCPTAATAGRRALLLTRARESPRSTGESRLVGQKLDLLFRKNVVSYSFPVSP